MVSDFLEIRTNGKAELTLEEEHIHKQYLCTAEQLYQFRESKLVQFIIYLFVKSLAFQQD